MVRCTICGHHAPYRDGMRYCAGCAAPLPLVACPGCRKENFQGDRYCAFCARPLPGVARPVVEGEVPAELTAGTDADELLRLAQETRARAEASAGAPPPTTKRHLGQDDIDALFGGGNP